MQVRCQHCGWMFTLSREAIGLALAEALAKNERHHTINCIQCRHAIKLQVSDLRRQLPPDYELPQVAPQPAAEDKKPAASKPARPKSSKPARKAKK